MSQPASPFDDQPVAPTTASAVDDSAFDSGVLDLDALPAPATDAECQVHATARAAFARLAEVLGRKEAGEPLAPNDLQIAESDATESLLAYKRLLAARAG